ncbi:sulfurtransferase [Endozoicomonas sp. ONNA2]|uniref:sulfurtransferase n=1 Tax=Endozoicomonas sp. ONNA2 TaxID=2828741 RepID=UPI002147D005|nr:rhodanese-like domain-containing protein [Endozoicomonas sp. ONNA2]
MKYITVGAVCLIAAAFPIYRNSVGVRPVAVDGYEQSAKIAEYHNPDAFITSAQLQQLMESDQAPVVIGTLNPMKLDPVIDGSFTVWRSDYSTTDDVYPFDGMRSDQQAMEAMLSSFGATPESTIVVYAANDHHDAGRLYWQIKMLGHEDVRILDGGLNAWVGADLPTGNGNPDVAETSYQAPAYSEEELATYDMVVQATNDSDWVILDTRSLAEHDGAVTESGAFGPGTIDGSEFLEWNRVLNKDTTLKTREELQMLYGDLIKGKKVIAYCQSGVRSAHTTLVLKEILGAEAVYNYDGSWIEWSHAHYKSKNPTATIING